MLSGITALSPPQHYRVGLGIRPSDYLNRPKGDLNPMEKKIEETIISSSQAFATRKKHYYEAAQNALKFLELIQPGNSINDMRLNIKEALGVLTSFLFTPEETIAEAQKISTQSSSSEPEDSSAPDTISKLIKSTSAMKGLLAEHEQACQSYKKILLEAQKQLESITLLDNEKISYAKADSIITAVRRAIDYLGIISKQAKHNAQEAIA